MKGNKLAFSLLVIGSLMSGCAEWLNGPQQAAPPPAKDTSVDLAAEPSHHLILQNEYTRAFKAQVEPDASTLKHHHGHDYVTVTYGWSQLSNEVDGKEPVKVTFNDGDVKYVEGRTPPHLVHNLAATTFRNLTIEIVKDADKAGLSKWDPDHGTVSLQGGTRDILFANAVVRVSRIELGPGGAMPKGDLRDHALFVAQSDLDLRDDANAHPVHLQAGEAKWENAGGQTKLMNRGTKPAKMVLLEFL